MKGLVHVDFGGRGVVATGPFEASGVCVSGLVDLCTASFGVRGLRVPRIWSCTSCGVRV